MKLSLSVEFKSLGVPYTRAPDDKSSMSYIDLRSAPDRIADIPEARASRPLRDLLGEINKEGGQLSTVGCGYCPRKRDEEARWFEVTGYIALCFADVPANSDLGQWYGLYHHFATYADSHSLSEYVRVQLILRHTVFVDHYVDGWSLEYHFWSSADRQGDAHKEATTAISLLGDWATQINHTPLVP